MTTHLDSASATNRYGATITGNCGNSLRRRVFSRLKLSVADCHSSGSGVPVGNPVGKQSDPSSVSDRLMTVSAWMTKFVARAVVTGHNFGNSAA